jgi:hypothetical protein
LTSEYFDLVLEDEDMEEDLELAGAIFEFGLSESNFVWGEKLRMREMRERGVKGIRGISIRIAEYLPQIHEGSSLPCLPRICNVELRRPMIGGGSTAHPRREGSGFRVRPPSIP